MTNKRDFYQVSLKAILMNGKGEVLGLAGVDHGSLAGFYDLPGGRIDVDEFTVPFVDILEREVREEVPGIAFSLNPKVVAIGRHRIPAHLTNTGKDIHILNVFFEGEYHGGEITISAEHKGYQWIDITHGNLEKYFTSGILEGMRSYMGNESRS